MAVFALIAGSVVGAVIAGLALLAGATAILASGLYFFCSFGCAGLCILCACRGDRPIRT